MCQVARGSVAASTWTSRSGLYGARFVAKTVAWIVASSVGRWSAGWSGVITVTRSSSGVLPASAFRS